MAWTLAAFLQLTPNLLKPMVIYPLTAMQLLGQAGDTQWIGSAFSKSIDRIICIYPSDSHWALLWGQLHVGHLQWLYCDGLPGQATCTATRLAAIISTELSLDWTIHPGHLFAQHDQHTCGTVALLHVGVRLGLFGLPSHLGPIHPSLKLLWLLFWPRRGFRHNWLLIVRPLPSRSLDMLQSRLPWDKPTPGQPSRHSPLDLAAIFNLS